VAAVAAEAAEAAEAAAAAVAAVGTAADAQQLAALDDAEQLQCNQQHLDDWGEENDVDEADLQLKDLQGAVMGRLAGSPVRVCVQVYLGLGGSGGAAPSRNFLDD
jgi:hypothetical protein